MIVILPILALLVCCVSLFLMKQSKNTPQKVKVPIEIFTELHNECIEYVDPLTLSYASKDSFENAIYFETKNKDIIKNIPLKTIKFVKKDGFGYYRYKASLSEYNNFFEKNKHDNLYKYLSGSFRRLIKNEYANTIESIERSQDKYEDILIKYEITFMTILNTIKECIETNDFITASVEEKSIEIIKRFIDTISARKAEINELDEKMSSATNKSFSERLDFELEYINRIK